MEIHRSDLQKIYGALKRARDFLILRDRMNAELHQGEVIYAPITSTMMAETDRLERLLKGVSDGGTT